MAVGELDLDLGVGGGKRTLAASAAEQFESGD